MPFIDPDNIWLPKAVVEGGLNAALTNFVLGNGTYVAIPILERSAPMWAVGFVLGFAGSLVSDATHVFVRDQVHLSKKHKDEASLLLGSVVAGSLYTGGLYLVNPRLVNEYGMFNSIAVGSGAEVLSSFVVGNLNEML